MDDDAIAAVAGLRLAGAIGTVWRIDLARPIDPIPGTTAARYQVWYADYIGNRIYILSEVYGNSVLDAIARYDQAKATVVEMEESLPDETGSRSAGLLTQLLPPSGCELATRAEGYEPYTRYPIDAVDAANRLDNALSRADAADKPDDNPDDNPDDGSRP